MGGDEGKNLHQIAATDCVANRSGAESGVLRGCGFSDRFQVRGGEGSEVL